MKKYIGLCYLAMLLSAPVAANAGTAQDAAYDDRNHAVMDVRGNCVRTKWMGNEDPCAPAPTPAPKQEVVAPTPAPAPVVAPEPAPELVLAKEARTVYFDFNKATLTAESQEKLKSLATQINATKRITSVHVVGFTDQYGSDTYNQALSQKRVDAVRSFLDPLITLHIDPSTAEFRAAGKSLNSKCDAVKKRADRIVCMKEERRVELEFGYEQVK